MLIRQERLRWTELGLKQRKITVSEEREKELRKMLLIQSDSLYIFIYICLFHKNHMPMIDHVCYTNKCNVYNHVLRNELMTNKNI